MLQSNWNGPGTRAGFVGSGATGSAAVVVGGGEGPARGGEASGFLGLFCLVCSEVSLTAGLEESLGSGVVWSGVVWSGIVWNGVVWSGVE